MSVVDDDDVVALLEKETFQHRTLSSERVVLWAWMDDLNSVTEAERDCFVECTKQNKKQKQNILKTVPTLKYIWLVTH